MEYAVKTLQQAITHFADFENCRNFMEFMRWPDGVIKCPYCGATKLTWLAKEKVYFCYGDHKRKKFSLKVRTVFEDSPIGLEKWLPAFWLLCNCKNGISSYELAKDLGVTQKTAWFMLHRIRMAMESQSILRMGGPEGGTVEIDETFIGGKPKNMHIRKRIKAQESGQNTEKAIVMGMLERGTRQVRATVIPNVSREILQAEILDQLQGGSKVFTDAHKGYASLKERDFVHETVSHINEYVRGEVHTQGIENFWSLLKRSLSGTYVAVEPFHLSRYVNEQVFRVSVRSSPLASRRA
jgi:ISXO2-like transposase domain/Transposase zinc-ribbon domain